MDVNFIEAAAYEEALHNIMRIIANQENFGGAEESLAEIRTVTKNTYSLLNNIRDRIKKEA